MRDGTVGGYASKCRAATYTKSSAHPVEEANVRGKRFHSKNAHLQLCRNFPRCIRFPAEKTSNVLTFYAAGAMSVNAVSCSAQRSSIRFKRVRGTRACDTFSFRAETET